MLIFSSWKEAAEHVRMKFTSADEIRRLMEEHDLILKRGEYNSYEASIIDNVMKSFFFKRQLTLKDLHAFFLEESQTFPIKELLKKISSALGNRTMNSVWVYVSYHYHPYVDVKWEPENEIQLLNLVKIFGFKWKKICGMMRKSSRKCISNYYKIMGFKYLYKYNFKLADDDIPVTDEEWHNLCVKMNTNRRRLSHLINGYISGKLVSSMWNEYNNMVLMAYVIFYNHCCSIKIKIHELLAFVNSGSVGVKSDQEAMDKVREKIAEFIPDLLGYHLDIPVEIDDIFWRTIKLFVSFPSNLLRSRFIQILKMYGIRTFMDLLDVFRGIVFDCYLHSARDKLKEDVCEMMSSRKKNVDGFKYVKERKGW